MKSKIKVLWIAITMLIPVMFSSCGTTCDNEITYKTVTPTDDELSEITERLNPILSTYFDDYDYSTEDMYNNLFSYNHLKYVCPEYDEEVTEFIDEPLRYLYGESARWEITVYENDPLGYFGKIPDEAYNEDGNVDKDLAYDRLEIGEVIGYTKFSGAYIDWLVEGVWNGKVNHDTVYSFDDSSQCYYHDGFYYTPETISALGGGIFHYSEVQSVSPLENNKYEINYVVFDENDMQIYCGSAVIALKESQNGFRFWSIFNIDIERTDT